MRFSVIIPNLHSPIIDNVLTALKNQSFSESYEILVVGQDKYGLVQEDSTVRHLITKEPVSPAIARNIGIREAQGEILAFIDADCIADVSWLEKLNVYFKNPPVMVVGGGVSFPNDNYWTLCDNLATFYEYLSTTKNGERNQLPSLNLSLRRGCIERSGHFDERYPFPAGEDSDFTTRLRQCGYTLCFDPEISVTHLPGRRGVKSILEHAYRFGRFSIKVDQRYRTFLKTPFVFRCPILLILLSPLLAAGVLWRMAKNSTFWRYLYTAPVIFMIKLIWCFGAAHTLIFGSPLKPGRN